MVLSTKTKLITLIAGSLMVLAAGVGLFTLFSVEQTMAEKQRQSCINAVSLASLNVMDRHQILFREKAADAVELRQKLSTLAAILSGLGEKQADLLLFLRQFPLEENISLTAVDRDFTLCLTRGELASEANPYRMRDIKGRLVGKTMRQLTKTRRTATSLIQWTGADGGQRRFFGMHFYAPKSGLLVGIWANIAHVEKRQAKAYAYAVEDLRKNLSSIQLGPSGFIFITDASGKVVIGPEDVRLEPFLTKPSASGAPSLIDRFKKARSSEQIQPLQAVMPVRHGEGGKEALLFAQHVKPFDWYVTGVAYVDEIRRPGQELSFILIGGIAVAVLFILFTSVTFADHLTAPLTQLAECARQLPEQNFMEDAPPPAALTSLSHGRHGDEVERLAQSCLLIDTNLRARVREHMEPTSSRERLEGELLAAKEIQMGFLPKPLPPGVSASAMRFALSASLVPAREVGGDLYDFFMLDEHRLCFVIGDVSDKGVPASLFMSMTLTLIRSGASRAGSPDQLMAMVNESLSRDNAKCMFVTLFIGILDLASGEVVYANGGHNPPLLLPVQGEPVWLEELSGPIVGVMEDAVFTPFSMRMRPGDILFLYTDGLNEAMNAQGEMYSNETMFSSLATCPLRNAEGVLQEMLHDVATFVGDTPASDDMTILCVQYLSRTLEPERSGSSSSGMEKPHA